MKPNYETQLTKVLYSAMPLHPIAFFDLHEQLEILLQNHPELIRFLNEEEVDEPSTMLVEHFYDIELPQHKNAFQQFYYLLYRQEALRFFNSLIFNVEKLEAQLDKDFQVGKAMDAVRVLCIQINDALKDYDPALPENEVTSYALTVARSILIALFFEIQDYFSLTLENPIPEKFFFQNFLHIPYDPNLLKTSTSYYENFYLKMYQYDWFEIKYAKDMLSQIKSSHLKDNEWLLARYENGIFLYENGYSQKLVYEDFIIDGCEHILRAQKKEWAFEMDKLNTGFERLMYINELLDDLEYVNENRNNKHSIPSRLYKFLLQQKEIYSTQLSVTFTSDITLYQDHTFNFKNEPPPEVDLEEVFPNAPQQNEKDQQSKSKPNQTKLDAVSSSVPATEIQTFKFGFKQFTNKDKIAALKSCILQLCDEVNLLNEEFTSPDDLLDILTKNRIKPPSQNKIRLDCETTQFGYIVDKLEPYFSNLNPKTIQHSGCFYSKKDTPITANNLYRNKSDNPRKKKEIDAIINQLQN